MPPQLFHSTIIRNTMKRLRPYIRTLVAVFELNDSWEPESAVFIEKADMKYQKGAHLGVNVWENYSVEFPTWVHVATGISQLINRTNTTSHSSFYLLPEMGKIGGLKPCSNYKLDSGIRVQSVESEGDVEKYRR